MLYRWMTIPALALGMMALAVNDGLAQRGGPGGGRGMPSPDEIWAMYGGGPDGIIDLSKNPKTAERMLQRGYTIPKDGIVRKEQFLAQAAQRIQAMQSGGMGGPPGGMSSPPATVTGGGDKPAVILVPGEDPQAQRGGPPSGGSDRGSRDRGSSGGPPGWGGSDRGSRGGDDTRKVEDPDDERPNVLRYGKTPKELPGWFTELDADKDAQIGLYEWRAAGKSIEDFLAKDLNGDGFLTVDEVLKNPGSGNSETKADSRGGSNPYSKNGSPSAPSADPRSNGKNDKGNKSDKSDTKPSKEEKKPESSGGNPFLKK